MTKNSVEMDRVYKDSIEAKSDAMLKLIGKKLLEERMTEIEQFENDAAEFIVSKETHEKIKQLIKTEKKRTTREKRNNSFKRCAKICGMLILILGVSGGVLVNNSEAFKYRFNNFLVEVKQEYIKLSPDEDSEKTVNDEASIPAGIMYPSYLPDDFEFSNYSAYGILKEIAFTNSDNKNITIVESAANGSNLYLDNEAEDSGVVCISNKYDGYWIKNGDEFNLSWLQCDMIIEISGETELDEIIKIAESLYVIK